MSNKYKNIALGILISVNVLEIQFFHLLQTKRDRVEEEIKILEKYARTKGGKETEAKVWNVHVYGGKCS